jgi:hypothetical protein
MVDVPHSPHLAPSDKIFLITKQKRPAVVLDRGRYPPLWHSATIEAGITGELVCNPTDILVINHPPYAASSSCHVLGYNCRY